MQSSTRIDCRKAVRAEMGEYNGDEKRKRRALSEDELERCLAAMPEHHLRLYRFCVTTGMRREELERLTWAGLKLNSPTPHTKTAASTQKSRRADQIALRQDVAAELKAMRPEGAGDTDK